MHAVRQARSKTGYLDVKLPAKARGRGLRAWKAWKRRWISLHSLHDLATGGIVITLDIYTSPNVEGQQVERSTIYLESVTLLQRTTSRSHPYAFCIEAKQTLVYLAGLCEHETQEWMDVVRNVLWPPVEIQDFDPAFTEVYSVAVVDATFSSLFGIRGGACHLLISENLLQLCCNHTGHALLEWPPHALARVFLSITAESRDQNQIFVIEPRPHFGGWTAPLHLFSSKAKEIVNAISECMKTCNRLETSSERKMSLPSTSFLRKHSISKWDSLERYGDRRRISNDDVISINSEVMTCMNVYDTPRMSSVHATSLYQIPPKRLSTEMTSPDSIYDQPRCHYSNTGSPLVDLAIAKVPSAALSRRRSLSESELNKQAQHEGKLYPSHSLTFRFPESFADENKQKPSEKCMKVVLRPKTSRSAEAASDDTKLLSVCSSVSSRDSGVQMNHSDESSSRERSNDSKITSDLSSNTESFLSAKSESAYRNVMSTATSSYEKRSDESSDRCSESTSRSSSSDSEAKKLSSASEVSSPSNAENDIYSEIDVENYSPLLVEPLYEDLDRFRKDVHKLLGIDAREKLGQPNEKAPPLPPRCPRSSSSRKKDVLRYLGINDPVAREVFQAQHMAKSSPQKGIRRKNLYQYLGVSNSSSTSDPLPEDAKTAPQKCSSTMPVTICENNYDVPLTCPRKSNSFMLRTKDSKTKKLLRRLKTSKEADFKKSLSFSHSYATLPKYISSETFLNYHSSGNLERLRSCSASQRSVSYTPQKRSFTSDDVCGEEMPYRDSLLEQTVLTVPSTEENIYDEPVKFILHGDEDQESCTSSSCSSVKEGIMLFADQFFRDLWTSVEEELLNNLPITNIEPVDLCQLADHELGQSIVLHRIYSDGTDPLDIATSGSETTVQKNEIMFDPLYLDMTPKTRNFPSPDKIAHLAAPEVTQETEALYQYMLSRSLSDSSYISLDWELKRQSSLKCCSSDTSVYVDERDPSDQTNEHFSGPQLSDCQTHYLAADEICFGGNPNKTHHVQNCLLLPERCLTTEENYINFDIMKTSFGMIPELVEEEKKCQLEEEREADEEQNHEEIMIQDESVATINETSIQPRNLIIVKIHSAETPLEGVEHGLASFEPISASCQENSEIQDDSSKDIGRIDGSLAPENASEPEGRVKIENLAADTSRAGSCRVCVGSSVDSLLATHDSLLEVESLMLVPERVNDMIMPTSNDGILPSHGSLASECFTDETVISDLSSEQCLLIDMESEPSYCISEHVDDALLASSINDGDSCNRLAADLLVRGSPEHHENVEDFEARNDDSQDHDCDVVFCTAGDAERTEGEMPVMLRQNQLETADDSFPDFATILSQWKRHSFSS